MLLVRVGIEFRTVWDLAACKTTDARTGLGVPKLNVTIVSRREEPFAIVVKTDITYRLSVSVVRSDASTVFVHLPQLKQTKASEKNETLASEHCTENNMQDELAIRALL